MLARKKMALVGALALAFVLPAQAAAEGMPDGAVYDDAFVFFDVENHEGNNKKHKRISEGWHLKYTARILGKDLPKRSALKLIIKSGKKKLGELRCEMNNGEIPWCKDREQRIKKKGKITIDVIYIDGDDDSETKIRTHTIFVEQIQRVRGNGEKDAPDYYLNRNGEIVTAIINSMPDGSYAYLNRHAGGRGLQRLSWNQVEIYIWAAPSEWNGSPDKKHPDFDAFGAFFRCTVDGEKLKLEKDGVKIKEMRHTFHTLTWGRGRRNERDRVSYRQYRLLPPISFGEDAKKYRLVALEDHKGKWDCALKVNGEVIRTFAWTVGEDGLVAPHAEEAHGVTMFGNAHLIETTIPKKTKRETRVDPKAPTKQGIFYGHKPVSDVLKKTIKALPKIGRPKPRKGG